MHTQNQSHAAHTTLTVSEPNAFFFMIPVFVDYLHCCLPLIKMIHKITVNEKEIALLNWPQF
jgi:hypothetical protein